MFAFPQELDTQQPSDRCMGREPGGCLSPKIMRIHIYLTIFALAQGLGYTRVKKVCGIFPGLKLFGFQDGPGRFPSLCCA